MKITFNLFGDHFYKHFSREADDVDEIKRYLEEMAAIVGEQADATIPKARLNVFVDFSAPKKLLADSYSAKYWQVSTWPTVEYKLTSNEALRRKKLVQEVRTHFQDILDLDEVLDLMPYTASFSVANDVKLLKKLAPRPQIKDAPAIAELIAFYEEMIEKCHAKHRDAVGRLFAKCEEARVLENGLKEEIDSIWTQLREGSL